MSIAYQALVLFVYIFPGLVFRRAASTAGRFRQPRTLVDEFFLSVIVATIAHIVAILGFDYLIGPRVGLRIDLDSAFMHAMGNFGRDSAKLDVAIHAVTEHVIAVALYFAFVNVVCLGAGRLAREGRSRGWRFGTRNVEWFDDEPNARRFREWSNILQTRKTNALRIPLLATVVDFGKTSYLYIGILEDVHWGADGYPECFILSEVIRRPFDWGTDLQEASENPKFFYEVLGTTFTINADDAKTLNILIRDIELPKPN